MIQFNLLPDVKLEYIKARRTKRLVMLASAVVTSVSLAVLIVLFFGTNILQRQHLNNLGSDIERDSKELQEQPDLNKILTVQNQLNTLPELHAKKPVAARLGTYLTQVTPNDLSVTTLDVDFTAGTMTFDGSAKALSVVNRFIDTLKFTTYKAGEDSGKNAFTDVVLANFGRSDEGQSDQNNPASYQVMLKFDPVIFNSTNDVQLQVPNITTTRSTTEKPNALFQTQSEQQGQGGQ